MMGTTGIDIAKPSMAGGSGAMPTVRRAYAPPLLTRGQRLAAIAALLSTEDGEG